MENIHTQITEIQNYFLEKIYNCEFEHHEIESKMPDWYDFTVKIDGYSFRFAVNTKHKISNLHSFNSLMQLTIDNLRIEKLIEFIKIEKEKIKTDKIEKLKSELAKLETSL